jgi:hypothetical protein
MSLRINDQVVDGFDYDDDENQLEIRLEDRPHGRGPS